MTTLRKSIIAVAFAAALPGLAFAGETVKAGQSAATESAKPVAGQQKAEAKGEVKAHGKDKVEVKDHKAQAAKSDIKATPAVPAAPASPAAPAAKQ